MVQPVSPATVCELERAGPRHAFHQGAGPEIRNDKGGNQWAEKFCLIQSSSCEPFVKRQKNDMADAEAITEAASRPPMRFVAVKSEAQQAAAMACRTRDLLVRQRTQTINALRAHLAEQGIVAPAGPAHVGRLAAIIDGDDGMLPTAVRDLARLLLDQIAGLAGRIADLDIELRRRVTTDDTARRLTTIPGVGAVTAAAITTFAPPMETFSKGRDFAAWVGLTPRRHSGGGKDRPDLEDGAARHPEAADRRGRRSGAMGGTQGRSRRVMACSDDGPQAEDAGRGGLGQPHGAHGLGAAAQGRGLQGSDDGGGIGRCRRIAAGCERERGNVRADGQETGSGEPSLPPMRLRARVSELVLTCISPYRPAAHDRPYLRRRTHDRT